MKTMKCEKCGAEMEKPDDVELSTCGYPHCDGIMKPLMKNQAALSGLSSVGLSLSLSEGIMKAISKNLKEFGGDEVFMKLYIASLFPERLTKDIIAEVESFIVKQR